jgi:hypothetical protein
MGLVNLITVSQIEKSPTKEAITTPDAGMTRAPTVVLNSLSISAAVVPYQETYDLGVRVMNKMSQHQEQMIYTPVE